MQALKAYFKRHGHEPFRFGEGRISGYLSAMLGLLSLLAVLCFCSAVADSSASSARSTASSSPAPCCWPGWCWRSAWAPSTSC